MESLSCLGDLYKVISILYDTFNFVNLRRKIKIFDSVLYKSIIDVIIILNHLIIFLWSRGEQDLSYPYYFDGF